MAFYQILRWQEIPSQIKAWDDFDEVRVELSQKFVAKIDQTAQSKGLTGTDEYLEQWQWSDEAERQGTAAEVAEAIRVELEASFKR